MCYIKSANNEKSCIANRKNSEHIRLLGYDRADIHVKNIVEKCYKMNFQDLGRSKI